MTSSLGWFLFLCVLARIGYSFNDILTGELARKEDPAEVAAWRGLSLGVTMLPLLLWVPASAWRALSEHWFALAFAIGITSISNVLVQAAARLLPFGLRVAFLAAGITTVCILTGIFWLGESVPPLALLWCAVLLVAACRLAAGDHATATFTPHIGRGAMLCLAGSICVALGITSLAQLARTTHPLLAGYLWEFGIGICCAFYFLARRAWQKSRTPLFHWPRILKIGAASAPTAIGTGCMALALSFGPLTIAQSLGGVGVVCVTLLGRWRHQEKIGPHRWLLIALIVAAIAGIGITMNSR